jgi:hypothetical protein
VSLFTDHFPILVLLAALMSAFAAVLWNDEWRGARRFFLKAFLGLAASAVALGFLFQLVTR